MVWGGITANYRTQLVIVQGTLSARSYIDQVVRPVIVPFMHGHPNVRILQQDNARPHMARLTMDFMRQNSIVTMPWPALYPDLSPIEHLWDAMKRAIRLLDPQPTTVAELTVQIKRQWDAIPRRTIKKLIRSMRRRTAACIRAVGGHTRY